MISNYYVFHTVILTITFSAQTSTGTYSVSCETPTAVTSYAGISTESSANQVMIVTQYVVTSYFDTCNGNTWSPVSIRTDYTEID